MQKPGLPCVHISMHAHPSADAVLSELVIRARRVQAFHFFSPCPNSMLLLQATEHIQKLGPAVEALSKDGVLEFICDKVMLLPS